MKKIVVANNKGGVGKTTIATQLAYKIASEGKSVVCLDFDNQGNFTSSLPDAKNLGSVASFVGSGSPVEIDLNPGDIGIVMGDQDLDAVTDDDVMAQIANRMSEMSGADFCIVDTPPSFSVVVFGALLAADFLLIPIEMKKYSIDGIEKVLESYFAIKEHNKELTLLGVLPSRFDAVKESERVVLAEVVGSFSEVVIPHAIRNRAGYERAQSDGCSIDKVPTKSGREASKEFGEFFDWFKERVY